MKVDCKKLNCSILLLLTVQVQNMLKVLHFGVKFSMRFGPVKMKYGTVPPSIFQQLVIIHSKICFTVDIFVLS